MNSLPLLSLITAASLLTGGCNGSQTNPPPPPPAKAPEKLPQETALPPGHPPLDVSTPAMPPGHPPIDMSSQTLPAEAKAAVTAPQWNVPAGWTTGPVSSMRVGSFKVAGDGSQSAEIAVSAFPGDVGGTLANINRWRGQLGLGPIKQEDVAGISTPIEAGDIKGTVVNIDAGAKRMLVATLPHDGNSWFFKMTGDAVVVEAQKENFLQFVKSVKF
jgi:hypothetical protein